VCVSPGHETKTDLKTGIAEPGWCWVKYGCDFIKMPDGKWYIWHLFVMLTMWAWYEKSWAEGGEHRSTDPTSTMPDYLKPDAPSLLTHHQPYDPKVQREFIPAFPLPYETYDEAEGVNWMVPNPVRRKQYPHDLEGTEHLWPNGGWK
jgi:hypothetical protein